MRRAYIGFSSPVGYSYKLQAEPTRNNLDSSPNPVLFGSMGLMTLFDELWFACESLCPQSMRGLPYVKYLDQHGPRMEFEQSEFDTEIERLEETLVEPRDFEAFNRPFGGLPEAWSDCVAGFEELATDNHTHGLAFHNLRLSGNPAQRQLLWDHWLLARIKDLGLNLVYNPLTADLAMRSPRDPSFDPFSTLRELEVTEQVLTLGSLYDITGPQGPYHPVIDQLREDELLTDFRQWAAQNRGRMDNKDLRTIQEDVDAKVREFTDKALRSYVKRENLASVGVQLVKGGVFDLIPGGSVISTVSDAMEQNKQAERDGWKAYIALTRRMMDDARNA